MSLSGRIGFDYRGYSTTELESLCNAQNSNHGTVPWMFWTAEIYSFGKNLRDYAYLPSFIPLNCYTDHGAGYYYDERIPPHELNNDSAVQLYHSPYSVEMFKKVSSKPCYCMLSPVVWCRKKNKIEQIANPRGTLAFAAHATPDVDVATPYEDYIQELKQMDACFHPICVCLHMHDIRKGYHKIFIENGFPVYTAGDTMDVRFAERFYAILKNFKYSTSPMIGSYTYYSVELGVPFFLHGQKPLLINKSDSNIQKGKYEYATHNYTAVAALFSEPVSKVSSEQKKFVQLHLGVNDCLSRRKMFFVLILALFEVSFFKFAATLVFRKCAKILKKVHHFGVGQA